MSWENPHEKIVDGKCVRCGMPVFDPEDMSKPKYLCMTVEEWDEAMRDIVWTLKRLDVER